MKTREGKLGCCLAETRPLTFPSQWHHMTCDYPKRIARHRGTGAAVADFRRDLNLGYWLNCWQTRHHILYCWITVFASPIVLERWHSCNEEWRRRTVKAADSKVYGQQIGRHRMICKVERATCINEVTSHFPVSFSLVCHTRRTIWFPYTANCAWFGTGWYVLFYRFRHFAVTVHCI